MASEGADAAYATSAAEARALAHPTRIRLWTALADDEATISQLANRLSLNKGSVSHHLRVLAAADLVRRTRSRTVRGGTEQYYARTVDKLQVPARRGADSASSAMLRALMHEIESSRSPHVHQRTIRLAPAQAAAVTAHLDKVLESLVPGDPRHPTYGIVTAVYRSS